MTGTAFGDWMDCFRQWQKDLGIDLSLFGSYSFDVRFAPVSPEIDFGSFKGASRWENAPQIPEQRIRDSVVRLIVYQGDAELAAPELHKDLLGRAPSGYDLRCALRIMREEMRHGLQMAHLLVNYFGGSGAAEARKLLERRGYEGTRLHQAFNLEVTDWLDYFCQALLLDRDGKYQLTMLSRSAFKPLAMSTRPMLQEEAFHLSTGYAGMRRILKAGRVPVAIVQKHINKWFSSALDLFGVDHSTSAFWFYVWGLKGRFDEDHAAPVEDPAELNALARQKYRSEVAGLLRSLNLAIPGGQPLLSAPDMKFNRHIGEHAGKPYSTGGRLLSEIQYAEHVQQKLPTVEDKAFLREISEDADWISPPPRGGEN